MPNWLSSNPSAHPIATGNQQLHDQEGPPDHEPAFGPHRATGVPVKPTGRRHLLGELADTVRYEHDGEQGEGGGKRQRGPCKRETEQQGKVNGLRGAHVRYGLEKYLG